MSNTANTVLVVIVVAAIAAGIYYWTQSGGAPWSREGAATEETSEAAVAPSDSLPTSDASDQSLDRDLASIEAQLEAFDSDNASTNASLSDTPGEQSSL